MTMKRWFLTVTLGLCGLLCLALGGVTLADDVLENHKCEGVYTTCNYTCYPSSYTCKNVQYNTITQPNPVEVGGCEMRNGYTCTNTMLQCDIDCYQTCPNLEPDCTTKTMISGCDGS
jgi:hypothetical protein